MWTAAIEGETEEERLNVDLLCTEKNFGKWLGGRATALHPRRKKERSKGSPEVDHFGGSWRQSTTGLRRKTGKMLDA